VSARLRLACGAALAAGLALAPAAAHACSVCFAATEEQNRVAYLVTTVLMSVLPLGMVGGLVWWLHRRAQELRAQSARSASIAASSANK
jgi:high-affinity Fe2+/Pb2+ permease